MCLSVCLPVGMYMRAKVRAECAKSHGDGAIGSCEAPDVGAENEICALCRSSTWPSLLSHLSSSSGHPH